ncbi:hypothetical protein N0V90_011216 [Kalmusia sp. IMI 367209]|nr:hypothetical protein N0V90_011216 [Kalmusia sp. IMI 367209]
MLEKVIATAQDELGVTFTAGFELEFYLTNATGNPWHGHWKIRDIDATANLFLALAVIVGSGLRCIPNAEELQWKDYTIMLIEQEKVELGPITKMPTCLDEAMAAFVRSWRDLDQVLDLYILHIYSAANELEVVTLNHFSQKE